MDHFNFIRDFLYSSMKLMFRTNCYMNIECPINIPNIEKYVWDRYVFSYGVRI